MAFTKNDKSKIFIFGLLLIRNVLHTTPYVSYTERCTQAEKLMKSISKFLILVCLIASCSNQEKRIELLENELNIDLGKNFTVIKDEDISHNGFESDYTLKINIKLNKVELERIVKQIETEPYFDQLSRFRSEKGRYQIAGNENMIFFNLVTDSLKKTKHRGSWFRTDSGFEFLDLEDGMEPIEAVINLREQTLKFEFNHL